MVKPDDGEVVGASWRSWMSKGGKEGKEGNGKGRGDFDIITVKEAPAIVFDKAVKEKGAVGASVSAEGEEEVVEKTLLQK